jgi:hypothetical protein
MCLLNSLQENCKWGLGDEILEDLFGIRFRDRSEMVMVYAIAWQTFVDAVWAACPSKIITSQSLYFVRRYKTDGICLMERGWSININTALSAWRSNSHIFDESGRQAALVLWFTHTHILHHMLLLFWWWGLSALQPWRLIVLLPQWSSVIHLQRRCTPSGVRDLC